MKLKSLALLGVAALLSVSCNPQTAEVPAAEESAAETTPTAPAQGSPPTTPTATETPVSENTPLASGSFVTSEKTTEGTANLVAENGQTVLVLDETFKTGNGPDVFVLLHKEDNPQDYSEANYINLGKMQKTTGMQRYPLPSDVNPAGFRSAVIWCRQFNATFGYAPLSSE